MARKPMIAGNWKMHKTQSEVVSTIQGLRQKVDGYQAVEVVVCPTFTSLAAAAKALEGSTVKLGAQNVHWEPEGAYTGEISLSMLLDCGCQFVILGHSERRHIFDEDDGMISRKLSATLGTALTPILCVGETLDERDADRVEDVVLGQMRRGLDALTEDEVSRIIVAYEPVWAIGIGRTATPEVAEEVHAMIRGWLRDTYSEKLSEQVRILYGGSVKPGNIAELMAQPDIDGALVGGASLKAESFAQIVKY
jgi:triosephosphate isomerase (TIM)